MRGTHPKALPSTLLFAVPVLLVLAALLYLLDGRVQLFEQVFPVRMLADMTVALPLAVQHHFADFAWAVAAATLACYVFASTRATSRLALVLTGANSWEMLQGAGLVSGTFDVLDVGVSSLAGLLVWSVHELANRRLESE